MGCLGAIGYIALSDLIGDPTASSDCLGPSCASDCDGPDGAGNDCGAAELGDEPGRGVDGLTDEVAHAVASNSVESISILLELIAKLEASESPDGLKLVIALPRRLAAAARAAAAAGHLDEERRLEEAYHLADSAIGRPDLLTASNLKSIHSPLTAIPSASTASPIGDPHQQRESAEQPTSPLIGSGASAEHLSVAGDGDRVASAPNAAASAPPSSPADQSVDAAPPKSGESAPPAPDRPIQSIVGGLPALAPVRVVLNVAREDVGSAQRAADIQQALGAAGLAVTDLVPVNSHQPRASRATPSIGYYFQSDHDAAAGVSHLLEPLLGAVDPVALVTRGRIPEPGTIEVAIP